MTGGDPDQLDIASVVEGLHQLEGCDCGTAGNGMPALFERHRDSHGLATCSTATATARWRSRFEDGLRNTVDWFLTHRDQAERRHP
jgi:hypothetical protein